MTTPPDPDTLPNITECLNEKPLDAFLCIQKEAAESSALRNYTFCDSGSLPVPLSNEPECPSGFYCPFIDINDTSTWPQYCPPTNDCALLRFSNQWCPAQGKYEPVLCDPGYYCPTPNTKLPCPEGYFCVRGTSVPQRCSILSLCPEGTHIGIFYGGTVFSLIMDIVLLILFLWYYYYAEPLWTKQTSIQRRLYMLFQGKQLIKYKQHRFSLADGTNISENNEDTSLRKEDATTDDDKRNNQEAFVSTSTFTMSYDAPSLSSSMDSTPNGIPKTQFMPTMVTHSYTDNSVATTLSDTTTNESMQTLPTSIERSNTKPTGSVRVPNNTSMDTISSLSVQPTYSNSIPSSLVQDTLPSSSIDNHTVTVPNPFHHIYHPSVPVQSNTDTMKHNSTLSLSTIDNSPSIITTAPAPVVPLPLPPSLSSVTVAEFSSYPSPPPSSTPLPPPLPPSSSTTTPIVPLLSNSLWSVVEFGRSIGRQLSSVLRINSSLPPGVIIEDIGNGKKRLRTNSMRRSSTLTGSFLSTDDTPSSISPTNAETLSFAYGNDTTPVTTPSLPSTESSFFPVRSPQILRNDRIARMSNGNRLTASFSSSSSSVSLSPTSPKLSKASQLIRRPSIYIRDSLIRSIHPNDPLSDSSSSPSVSPSNSSSSVDPKQLLSSWFLARQFPSSSSSDASRLADRHTISAASAVLGHVFQACNTGLRLQLQFENLGLTLPPPISKTILASVTGEICPGRVTAVMGPSGAGKTTFLSVLMGRTKRTHGILRINNTIQEMEMYRQVTGFVPQDDVMLAELTVRENIEYSARIRLPRNSAWTKQFSDDTEDEEKEASTAGWNSSDDTASSSSSFVGKLSSFWSRCASFKNRCVQEFTNSTDYELAIRAHVDAVIEVLGLNSCADTLAANISGGQRKRTNIGIELAAAPTAVFLDEPTSGLDATAALEVCATLRVIANLGLTVVAVIHQPRAEIFASFDDLLLLAPGGRTVYMGPQKNAVQYFLDCGMVWGDSVINPSTDSTVPSSIIYRNGNPADVVLDFIAGRDQLRVPKEDIDRLQLSSSSSSSSSSSVASTTGSFTNVSTTIVDDNVSPTGIIEGSSVALWLSDRWNIYQTKMHRSMNKDTMNSNRTNTLFGSTPSLSLSSTATVQSSFRQLSLLTQSKLDQTRKSFSSTRSWCTRTCGFRKKSLPHTDPLTILLQNRGATFTKQFLLALERSFIQQYRRPSWLLLEIAVVVAAGGIMGLAATAVEELFSSILKPPYTILSPSPLTTMLPSLGLYINMAIGIAGSPAAVRIFGEEGDVAIREARTGHNTLAYYLAKQTASLPRLILAALHFASVFCLLALPTSNFYYLLGMSLGIFFGTYGLGICVSLIVSRANASLVGVIGSLIMACLCGFGPNINQFNAWNIGFVHTLAVSRWANELWIHAETLLYRETYLVDEITTAAFGYTLDRPVTDSVMMLTLGIGLRIIAYGLLWFKLRN